MVVWMARRMAAQRKVQVGVNAPLAEAAALLAMRLAEHPISLYVGAMSGVHYHPRTTSLFRTEWESIARGSGFPLETLIDLMGGWEGVDDEPVHPIQIDQRANINLSGIHSDDGRLCLMGPGAAGADLLPYMLHGTPTIYTTRHSRRTLVSAVSRITASMLPATSATRPVHEVLLITNLCVLAFTAEDVSVVSVHDWVSGEEVIAQTGFAVELKNNIARTPAPTGNERELLGEVDPNDLRVLEFFPSSQRLERVLSIWNKEVTIAE